MTRIEVLLDGKKHRFTSADSTVPSRGSVHAEVTCFTRKRWKSRNG